MARTREQLERSARDAEAWLDGLEGSEEVDDPADLREIATAARRIADAQQALQDAVNRARANGRSWGRIGLALGVSRQAARERFGTGRPAGQRRQSAE